MVREMEKMSSTDDLHVVMFPWFAFGHISPFVQLSNTLSSHGIKVSFFSAPGNIPRISNMLTSNSKINIIPLKFPSVEGLPPGVESTSDMPMHLQELLKVALNQMHDQIEELLVELKPGFIFLDFCHYWIPKVADRLGIKSLFFSVFSAVSTAYLTNPGRLLPENCQGESPSVDELKKSMKDFPESSCIKSMKTFQAKDFMYVFMNFNGPNSCVYDRVVGCMQQCTGIVIKSCYELEKPYIDYVKDQFKKPVLLAGPVVPKPPSGTLDAKWDTWLSTFPAKSVIYCSFGSETFLKNDQITELVLGLEMTGLPYLVVLNFAPGEKKEGLEFARGLVKDKEKGVIYTGWVQQHLILAHESVGCYVNHSGFSSVTEAITSDCHLVLLAQKGDQFLNSKLVCGDMKAGVEVNRRDEDGYFAKEDLCKAVKIVMVDIEEEPGRTIRENHQKWKKFLMDRDVHDKFIEEFVKDMKAMVVG